MEERIIKVGITHGDINGISYELILKAFSDARIVELCTPVIYGSSKIAAYHRKALELPPLNMSSVNRAEDAGAGRINIINCINDETKVELARPTEIAGEAALRSLEVAVGDLKRGAIQALVTTPVSSRVVMLGSYPLHAAYLEKQVAEAGHDSLTMLVSGEKRIALFTNDMPLSKVASQVTFKNLVEKLVIFDRTLKQDFHIIKPRIAVLSLNPKAGNGWADSEEQTIMIPAMENAGKQNGIMSFGPYPVDSFFGSQMYGKFDGILAMYHDQGIGPFRALLDEKGVYYTAGLPFIHTAPAHGAAYDIVGRNLASEDSFRQAIYTALDIFRNRNSYKEATANPLRKQYFEKGSGDDSVDLTKDYDDNL